MLLLQLNIVSIETLTTHTHSNKYTVWCGLFIYTVYITHYFMVMLIQNIHTYIHIYYNL